VVDDGLAHGLSKSATACFDREHSPCAPEHIWWPRREHAERYRRHRRQREDE
jgi:hypothetical protein